MALTEDWKDGDQSQGIVERGVVVVQERLYV